MNILTNLISLLREEAPFFLHLTAEHLLISLSAIVVASLIGVLLGIFISEYRKYAAWLLGALRTSTRLLSKLPRLWAVPAGNCSGK